MSETPRERDSRRANAATHLATGGALLGAAAGANYVNDRSLERKGLDKPIKAARKRKLRPAHGRYLGVKAGIRAAQISGLPLAAYGAYNLIKPDKEVPRVSPRRDVARPIARAVTLQDARDEARRRVAKEALTADERRKLVRRKRVGRDLSLVGGGLGLTALALRSPELARVAASRSRKLAGTKTVQRLAAKEPAATKASNTLGIAAIGSGSIGSFNYASQQRLEAKQVRKSLPDKMRHAGRMRRVLGYDSKTKQIILDNPADPTTPYRIARGGKKVPKQARPVQLRLFEKKLSAPQLARAKARARAAGRRYPNAYDNMVSGGAPWRVNKRDDRFLRRYRDRISPDAERGYDYMRRQRNKDRAWAATQAGLTGVNAAGTVAALRARSAPFAALGAGLTAFSATQAVRHGRKARGYNKGPMEGIRRKAKQRAAAGLYGPGRGKEPVDVSSKRVGKALVPMRVPRSVPKGLLRRPTLRRSYVARRPSGRMVSVRGGFA